MAEKRRFPMPWEVEVPPELEGWEEMYPPYYLFSEERKDWEGRHFWYRDKIHAADPMPPWDLIFQEAWQMALSQNNTRVYCLPPAQGVAHRIVGCYMYITPVESPSPETVEKKAKVFQERLNYMLEHYPELWPKWLDKFTATGKELQSIVIPEKLPEIEPDELIYPAPRGYYSTYSVIEAYDRVIDLTFKAWQYHWEYLSPCYLAILTFSDVARQLFPGINEADLARFISGVSVSMLRPEEELYKLARMAMDMPKVREILKQDIPAVQKIELLKESPEGRDWLKAYDEKKEPWFYMSCGSGWLHYEGSWITKPDVPFGYLKGYVERLERGEAIERSVEEVQAERDRLVREYTSLIQNEEDRKSFEDLYRTCMRIYPFAEDHIFWVENWFHTILFEKMRQFGRLLTNYQFLNEPEDIFIFNRFEIPVMLEDLVTAWALGEGVPGRAAMWKKKVQRRKEILAAAKQWAEPPALGIPPEEVTEPVTIANWGVTTETVRKWLDAMGGAAGEEEVRELKGFAASAGVAEGRVRICRTLEEVADIQPGEVLVAPYTNPSWSPVFTKIAATVTDIGGMTTHAAIVAREYGVPAVTGTGSATTALKNGDLVRVDGSTGVVTILQRA
ncbi:MAG: PEP-utilizing enzyme [Moorellales bacterium]